jgi:hypothetical protein
MWPARRSLLIFLEKENGGFESGLNGCFSMLKAGKMFFSWDSQNNYVVFKVRVFVKQM